MKLSRYFSKLLWVLPALMLAACSDDKEPVDIATVTPSEEEGAGVDELTLTLTVPQYEATEIGSRAAANPTEVISSLSVFCYGTSGAWLETTSAPGPWTISSGKATITVPINRKTASIEVVTNYTAAASDRNPAEVYVPATSIDPAKPVMWGAAKISAIAGAAQGNAQVTLVRNYAKVTVQKATNATGNFTINSFGVTNTATQGSLAPADKSTAPVNVTNKAGETFTYNTTSPYQTVNASEAVYIFETPGDVANANGTLRSGGRIVINIDGSWYCVAFRQRTPQSSTTTSETPGAYNYSPLPILRNHVYQVKVLEVREEGWSTFAEAMKAAPDNRLTVLITDTTPAVTDITATRDYMLGVSDTAQVTADGKDAADETNNPVITVVSSYPGTPQISITSDQSWVKVPATLTPTGTETATSGANPTANRYAITLTVDANTSSTERSATLTVTSGLLTRTITLKQAGRDYRRDSNRKVTIILSGTNYSLNNADYFDWIDKTCKGLLPEQNRGVERNQGLHFPAVPSYTATYRIPKVTGDKSAQITQGTSYFAVTDKGSYYEVTLETTTPTVTTGTLKIVNSANVDIVYPLYCTGVFHQMTAEMATAYEHESQNLTGWYYYGVALTGNGKFILDRNLCADSNLPYISTYAGYSGNTGAIGAYLKISTQKSTTLNSPLTILPDLKFTGFKIPTEDDMKAWGITMTTAATVAGEQIRVAKVNVQNSSLMASNEVFIPHGGYYEGNSAKYETHANVWTSTLVSGNQGFSQGSPEFGYWYIYLNGYGTKVSFSTIRFANGSGGQAPTANSVYKYMPLRLMYNN
ncbi:MAG: hypothetical protein NC187_06895 [Candidatus Amulumruptor caecigallinarius]|nr:hypothetical protein [Candidatus Amulumruptor caecigallinarius]MCM1397195.1 hypothetical protein [Candidatus Amulumruptor caecigallinarius]MCM1453116.1 hypothetical protein [bacterium]